jgi:hypothetical protein
VVQSQPREIVHETLSQKTLHKNMASGVAQGVGPEFKPQYHKKKPTRLSDNTHLHHYSREGHLELVEEFSCYVNTSLKFQQIFMGSL